MKKGPNIILILFISIIVLIGLIFLFFLVISPNNDRLLFNKAIETGEVSYCHKIKSYFQVPGLEGTCISFIAQKNNDPSICEEGNELQKNDCYAGYAYYKDDETLCIEPQCSKTLFNYCKTNGCETIDDYS